MTNVARIFGSYIFPTTPWTLEVDPTGDVIELAILASAKKGKSSDCVVGSTITTQNSENRASHLAAKSSIAARNAVAELTAVLAL
jgi:hypothetical protein